MHVNMQGLPFLLPLGRILIRMEELAVISIEMYLIISMKQSVDG